MENQFNSLSEEIRYHIRELLADKELHSTAEIKQYVKETMSKDDISEGAFSGAIRDLIVKEPLYTNPNRGYYQLSERDSVLLISVEKVIKDARIEIEKELKKVDVSNLTESIFKEVVDTQKVIGALDKIIEGFED